MNYKELINKVEQENGLPKGLLFATIKNESNFNPNAVSDAGAQGLGQLMPETAKGLGVKNPFDPEENVRASGKFQGQLYQMFDNDPELTVMAYHAGPGNIKKYGRDYPGPKTAAYRDRVLADFNKGDDMAQLGEIAQRADLQKKYLDDAQKMNLANQALFEQAKAPKSADTRLTAPVANKKSNFADLILPILGTIGGAAFFGGPSGALTGLGMGTAKTMMMKQDQEKIMNDMLAKQAAVDAENAKTEGELGFKNAELTQNKDIFEKLMQLFETTAGSTKPTIPNSVPSMPQSDYFDLTQ